MPRGLSAGMLSSGWRSSRMEHIRTPPAPLLHRFPPPRLRGTFRCLEHFVRARDPLQCTTTRGRRYSRWEPRRCAARVGAMYGKVRPLEASAHRWWATRRLSKIIFADPPRAGPTWSRLLAERPSPINANARWFGHRPDAYGCNVAIRFSTAVRLTGNRWSAASKATRR
jgi:hypothetical protein